MALHILEPVRGNLHGSFSRDFAPALTIDPGDTVQVRTLDAGWNVAPAGNGPGAHGAKFEPRDDERDRGHALCGPIRIRGASPGLTLEVAIREIVPGAWGWSGSGGWESPENRRLGVLKEETTHCWTLDPAAMTGTNQHGHTVALRPFMGVMGMPPDEPGIHSTAPPRFCGGNIDCKELMAGTTLYLPMAVPGTLFSVGDGHARQGDGEVSTLALECPMDRVVLNLSLRDDMHLTTPCARTADAWLTLGFHEDLDEAAFIATEAMLDLMNREYGLARGDALALASLVIDLRVTQIVNGVRGVHAVLRDDAISFTR